MSRLALFLTALLVTGLAFASACDKAQAVDDYPFTVMTSDARDDGTHRLVDGVQGSMYVYPNSGWSTVYHSKVDSVYSFNQYGIFVEAGYYYEPDTGVVTPPRFFTAYYRPNLGTTIEWPSTMSSSDIETRKGFAILRTSGDDYKTLYDGSAMLTIQNTGMVSSWSKIGMERASLSDNGNLAIRYLQSRGYVSGNWSYWYNFGVNTTAVDPQYFRQTHFHAPYYELNYIRVD